MRKIAYLTGTRADFGLMVPVLREIASRPGLKLSLIITGSHLSENHGLTLCEVEQEGFPEIGRIPIDVESDSGAAMAIGVAKILEGCIEIFGRNRPDLLLVLGDRGEMLAATTAAAFLGIPIVHLCGGDRSGSIDESIRHAITKLAHIHLVATEGARERVIRMGELPQHVHVIGAPGLVGLRELVTESKDEVFAAEEVSPGQKTALVIFHPVVQQAKDAKVQVQQLLEAVFEEGLFAFCLMPNSDTGNSGIRAYLSETAKQSNRMRLYNHLPRKKFTTLMAHVDVMVGNSSSGIVEAACFGCPVVNVGDRQKNRERNKNVIDSEPFKGSIRRAIQHSRGFSRAECENVYGNGQTHKYVAKIIFDYALTDDLLNKQNFY